MTHRLRPIAHADVAEQPFSTINTTPMIDVMLVLLIMFIISLPLSTHSVKIDLPADGGTYEAETHHLALDNASRLSWNGAPITEAELPARLAAFRDAPQESTLHFRAEPETRYEDFDRILAGVKRAGVRHLGFVGNERFAKAY